MNFDIKKNTVQRTNPQRNTVCKKKKIPLKKQQLINSRGQGGMLLRPDALTQE